jgi:hypothetical protein
MLTSESLIGEKYYSIFSIDTTPPLINVTYSTTERTNGNVTAFASVNEGELNALSYTFTENGSFDFVAIDDLGNKSTVTALVTNIDKEPPTVIGVQDGKSYNHDVSINFDEGIARLNGIEVISGAIISDEGAYELTISDDLGNSLTINFSIDKTAPSIVITISETNLTNKDVLVTAFSPDGILNQASYLFNKNGEFTFISTDNAGNTTYEKVEISNIDKDPPTIIGVENGSFYNSARQIFFSDGSAKLNDIIITSGIEVTDEGEYTLVAEDSLGNMSTIFFTIDKTAPVITIYPYNLEETNQNITVSASVDEGSLNANEYTFTENGSFTFIATDLAGNVSQKTITISNILKKVNLSTQTIGQGGTLRISVNEVIIGDQLASIGKYSSKHHYFC